MICEAQSSLIILAAHDGTNVIKYLGSKRTLIPTILELVEGLGTAQDGVGRPTSVLDLFSGTSRVGHALKNRGYRVIANDHNHYAWMLARCYVAADLEEIEKDAKRLIREFNGMKGQPGYFTETFCEKSRFFQPKNGARVDAIRDSIAAKGLSPDLEAVLLVSLMEASDRVDSTTGVQMAYLKSWAARAHKDLELRMPAVLSRAANGKGEAHRLDAQRAASTLRADVVYIDPPYNQHKYLGNYHIWETLVRWDAPEVYGIACKRVDCRDRQSPFNSRPRFLQAFRSLIAALDTQHLVVSFNNEGFLKRPDAEEILGAHGTVTVLERDYPRYVGAQIGIYNPKGEVVGEVSHTRNRELIYVVSVGQ